MLFLTVEGRDTLDFDVERDEKDSTVCFDDKKVFGRFMNCNTSVILEEGEQRAPSITVIGTLVLVERDLKVSETAGSVGIPSKGIKKREQQLVLKYWHLLRAAMVKILLRSERGQSVLFNKRYWLLCGKQSTRTLWSLQKLNARLRVRCSMRGISHRLAVCIKIWLRRSFYQHS